MIQNDSKLFKKIQKLKMIKNDLIILMYQQRVQMIQKDSELFKVIKNEDPSRYISPDF